MRGRNRIALVATCAALLFGAVGVAAQGTTIEVRNAEVLAVQGSDLVVRGPDGIKRYTVPSDFRFDMDGRQLTVSDLEPGMMLSAIIKTTETPVTMTTTEVREATVVYTIGTAVVVRNDQGELKKFTTKQMKDKNLIIMRNGKPADPYGLKKGDRITATIVTELPPEVITEQEFQVFVDNPPPAAEEVVEVEAVETPEDEVIVADAMPSKELPKTGSPLPLVGLAGAAALALGVGLTIRRIALRG